jgi:hypothetical protein
LAGEFGFDLRQRVRVGSRLSHFALRVVHTADVFIFSFGIASSSMEDMSRGDQSGVVLCCIVLFRLYLSDFYSALAFAHTSRTLYLL